MATPLSYHKNKLNIAAILISSMLFLPSKPGVVSGFSSYKTSGLNGREKLQVGSRPPRCLNKCWSCRPCMATLVIQPNDRKRFKASGHGEAGDDVYYHLSWKCKCGNKLYHP
ncbi:hypothetical protein HRI_004441100 [Hibiscus trionum]|uniref:Epidermal patterning factor-like protein n=1 Tax=Hibiscus trionum TaxID=183268 RepID=A0A9W7MMK5_HIBTR|nr:hypothetical protein HRI_004441100 [Hibiscus trionum]